MTLDEAYRHIKKSYIHHSQERNAVLLSQAELIAMECIEKCKQADVQPIVRCKDCKYRKEHHYEAEGEAPYVKYSCKFTTYSMSGECFCSIGARMGGDTG